MSNVKQMIKRTEVEQTQRQRKCKFTGKPIEKDSLCLVLYEDSRDRYCYSKDVALKMIGKARTRLTELENMLQG